MKSIRPHEPSLHRNGGIRDHLPLGNTKYIEGDTVLEWRALRQVAADRHFSASPNPCRTSTARWAAGNRSIATST